MDNKELEKLLKESALCGPLLPDSKESLKNVLINLKKPYRRSFGRLWCFAVIIPVFFLMAAALLMVVEDNDQPGPINNLGGIWSTYTDSVQGGTSTVWPPVSTSCQNLFVKSKPGYGDKGYAIRITGTAGKTDSAYLGVETYLSQLAVCPRCTGIDLRMYKGIRFKMKGTVGQGKLYFILPHESRNPSPDLTSCLTLTGYHDYQADLTGLIKSNWTDVKLEFRKDFSQPQSTTFSQKVNIDSVLEDENVIKWHWNGKTGQKIDLWIDEVELF